MNATIDMLSAINMNDHDECLSTWGTILLGTLLVASELMPFVKRRCKEEETQSQPSLLEDSNGLLHLVSAVMARTRKTSPPNV